MLTPQLFCFIEGGFIGDKTIVRFILFIKSKTYEKEILQQMSISILAAVGIIIVGGAILKIIADN